MVSVPDTVTAPGYLSSLMVPLLISAFPAGTVRDSVKSAVNVLPSGIVPESSSVLPCTLYLVPVTDTLPEAWSFKAVLLQLPFMPYASLLPVPLTVKSPSCAASETSLQEDANTAVPLVLVMLRDFPAIAHGNGIAALKRKCSSICANITAYCKCAVDVDVNATCITV